MTNNRYLFDYSKPLTKEKDPLDHLFRLSEDFRYFFVHVVWPASTGDVFKYSQSFDMLSETAMGLLNGDLTRHVTCIPPRNGKSLIFSIGLSAYEWLGNPSTKFINVSHHADVLKIFAKNRQAVYDFKDYNRCMDYKITTNSVEAAINNRTGHVLCFDSLNIKTGLGADVIIVDDPVSVPNATRDRCDKVADIYDGALLSRLNDKQKSSIMVVSQRINDFDLPARLIDLGYTTTILPSIQPSPQVYVFPLSKKEWLREKDDVLNPEHEPLSVLLEIKKNRPKVFAAQYQQDPLVTSSGVLESRNCGMYIMPERTYDQIFVTIDSASSNSLEACPWAIVVMGYHWKNALQMYDVLAIVNRRMNYVEGMMALREVLEMWNPTSIIVENKSTGAAIIPVLAQEFGEKVIGINPKGTKEQRTMESAGVITHGRLRLPCIETNIHLENMVKRICYELDAFPNARTDDLSDAITQGINYFESNNIVNLRSFYGVK